MGTCLPLLSKADDHLVVMATGDEMTVKFKADGLPPLKPGWERSFFLNATGYAKDGEPNTAYARTVTPMPYRSMSNHPPLSGEQGPADAAYQAYLREYQTRPGYKLIPPLAPPVHEETAGKIQQPERSRDSRLEDFSFNDFGIASYREASSIHPQLRRAAVVARAPENIPRTSRGRRSSSSSLALNGKHRLESYWTRPGVSAVGSEAAGANKPSPWRRLMVR